MFPNLTKLIQNREINFNSSKNHAIDYHLLNYVYSNFEYCPIKEYPFYYPINHLTLDHTNNL